MQLKRREYGQIQDANAAALQAQSIGAIVVTHAPSEREQYCRKSRNAQIPGTHWYTQQLMFNSVLE